MSIRRSVAATALLAVVGASGCSAEASDPPAPEPSATASAPSPGSASTPSPGSASTTTGASDKPALPSEFPLPKGATMTTVAHHGHHLEATLIVRDGEQAITYWRSQLPAAGFRVTRADSVGGLGELRFSGHGCASGSQIAVTDTTVAVECDAA